MHLWSELKKKTHTYATAFLAHRCTQSVTPKLHWIKKGPTIHSDLFGSISPLSATRLMFSTFIVYILTFISTNCVSTYIEIPLIRKEVDKKLRGFPLQDHSTGLNEKNVDNKF